MRKWCLRNNVLYSIVWQSGNTILPTLSAKVETQDFASHEGDMRLLSAYYCMSLSIWEGRETQDFASLPGLRHLVNDEELKAIYAACKSRDAKSCVSQGGICDYCQAYYWMSVLLWEGRETQHFASLLGLRHWVNDEELKAICAACNSRDTKSCVSRGGICDYCQAIIV